MSVRSWPISAGQILAGANAFCCQPWTVDGEAVLQPGSLQFDCEAQEAILRKRG